MSESPLDGHKGRLVIRAVDPPVPPEPVTVYLTGEPSTETADGGWEVIPRPKRKGMVDWTGQQPYGLTVPVAFDAFAVDGSVEADIERVRRIMRVPRGDRRYPAVVTLDGPVPMVSQLRWVIQGMDSTGREERRASDGARTRAFYRLTFVEYHPGEAVVESKASKARDRAQTKKKDGGPGPSTRTHTVKAGDTLWAIAVRELGDGKRWPEIAKLNDVRDPRALQIGQTLRLP